MALGLNIIAQAKILAAARVRNRPDYMRHDTPAAYAVPPLRLAPGRESMLSVLLRDDAPADDVDSELDDLLSDVSDVEVVDDAFYCDTDSDEDLDTVSPLEAPSPPTSPQGLTHTASWVCSLKDFTAQRATARAAVESGAAVTAVKKGVVVRYERQADLDLYDEKEQKKRWRVRHDEAYFALSTRLWKLVRDDSSNQLARRDYLNLIVRFHRAIRPPPLNDKKIVASAVRDWDHDSKGETGVGFEGFFDAVYQVVDIWTETCEAAEYVDFLAQLVDDVATTDPLDGSLAWRHADSDPFLRKAMKRIDALTEGPEAAAADSGAKEVSQTKQQKGDARRSGPSSRAGAPNRAGTPTRAGRDHAAGGTDEQSAADHAGAVVDELVPQQSSTAGDDADADAARAAADAAVADAARAAATDAASADAAAAVAALAAAADAARAASKKRRRSSAATKIQKVARGYLARKSSLGLRLAQLAKEAFDKSVDRHRRASAAREAAQGPPDARDEAQKAAAARVAAVDAATPSAAPARVDAPAPAAPAAAKRREAATKIQKVARGYLVRKTPLGKRLARISKEAFAKSVSRHHRASAAREAAAVAASERNAPPEQRLSGVLRRRFFGDSGGETPRMAVTVRQMQKMARGFLARRRRIASAVVPQAGKYGAAYKSPFQQSGKSAIKHQRLLSPEATQIQIAHIYQAYVSAQTSTRPVRARHAIPQFDHFVVRYFRQLHGTPALAKRHASAFVASVQLLLFEGTAGEPRYPRACLFARVAGISPVKRLRPTSATTRDVVNRVMFNGRLAPDFVLPALLMLYGADANRNLSRKMRLVGGNAAVVERKATVDAFAEMLGAFAMPGLVDESESALLDQTKVEPSKLAFAAGAGAELHAGKDCVDVDAALWGLLRLYERGVRYEGLRRRVKARILAVWLRKHSRLDAPASDGAPPRDGAPASGASAEKQRLVPKLDLARQGPPRESGDARGDDDAAGTERAPASVEAAAVGAAEHAVRQRAATTPRAAGTPRATPRAAAKRGRPSPRRHHEPSPRRHLQEAIATDQNLNHSATALDLTHGVAAFDGASADLHHSASANDGQLSTRSM
ncbi:hypothetical protein M885DRAFT_590612 [Pelagophyceae sp. CCMP2097]|nr:hypothetical protein M885DRAFT_590612 [Pelagophyceae sp. CCMP2097]